MWRSVSDLDSKGRKFEILKCFCDLHRGNECLKNRHEPMQSAGTGFSGVFLG